MKFITKFSILALSLAATTTFAGDESKLTREHYSCDNGLFLDLNGESLELSGEGIAKAVQATYVGFDAKDHAIFKISDVSDALGIEFVKHYKPAYATSIEISSDVLAKNSGEISIVYTSEMTTETATKSLVCTPL